MIPHKTYIPHIPAFVYLICFHSQSILQSNHFNIFRPVLCSALLLFSVYTYLNLNRMLSGTFQIFLLIYNKKSYNLTFYSIFSTSAIFYEEMEPMFDIHNISIPTDDDIIQIGYDVNIYPVYLSRSIIVWGNYLNWLEKTIVLDHIFSMSCKLIWELINGH